MMTWQDDGEQVTWHKASQAEGLNFNRQSHHKPSLHFMPLQYAMSSSFMICILLHQPPPVGFFFFFPSFLPLPITQFHFPTMQILKTGTIIYQKTSQKFPFTNLWIFDKQSLKNVPKIKNKKSIINIL